MAELYLDEADLEALNEGRETKIYSKELEEEIWIKPPSAGGIF